MQSHILPKPAYCIFFRTQWHFQNRIAKIMPHPKMCIYSHIGRIFPHMQSHFSAFSLSNIDSRPLNIFGGRQLPVYTIRRWTNWMEKCPNCAEYAYLRSRLCASLPVKVAYARNMRKNMLHIYATYFAKLRIFCLKKWRKFWENSPL